MGVDSLHRSPLAWEPFSRSAWSNGFSNGNNVDRATAPTVIPDHLDDRPHRDRRHSLIFYYGVAATPLLLYNLRVPALGRRALFRWGPWGAALGRALAAGGANRTAGLSFIRLWPVGGARGVLYGRQALRRRRIVSGNRTFPSARIAARALGATAIYPGSFIPESGTFIACTYRGRASRSPAAFGSRKKLR